MDEVGARIVEKIKVSIVEEWEAFYVQVGRDFSLISKTGEIAVSAFIDFDDVLNGDMKHTIIIDEPIPPRWTIEDHLYNFLGEELYNEFWSECDFPRLNNLSSSVFPSWWINNAFLWRKSKRGHCFWSRYEFKWREYCEEMSLD